MVPRPLGFAVEAQGDIVSLIDDHDSPVHKVSCLWKNPLSCHMIHHTSCRLLQDCHSAQFDKLGASMCFDTGVPAGFWNRKKFDDEYSRAKQWIENQKIRLHIKARAEKFLHVKYQDGTVSFAFCLFCMFVALLGFFRRLATCYQQVLGSLFFVVVCAVLCISFYLYHDVACPHLAQFSHFSFLCPSTMQSAAPRDAHYQLVCKAVHVFARVFVSLVALPLALYALIPKVGDWLPMLKRYRTMLGPQHWMLARNNDHHEQLRFFLHLGFVLAVVGCCFRDDESGLSVLSDHFVLYDIFGFLMLAFVISNAIGLRIYPEQQDNRSDGTCCRCDRATSTATSCALHVVFFALIFLSFFLPSTNALLIVAAVALTAAFLNEDKEKQVNEQLKISGWRRPSDDDFEPKVDFVDWDDNMISLLNLFFFLAILYNTIFAGSFASFSELSNNVLWFGMMCFFSEFFARAASKKVFFFRHAWPSLCVWLLFSFVILRALGSMGQATPGAHVCLIVRAFLLHAVCNIQPNRVLPRNGFHFDGFLHHFMHHFIFASLLPSLYLSYLISSLLPTAILQLSWYTFLSLFLAIAVLRFGLSKFLRPDDVNTRLASLLAVFCHVVAVLLCVFRVHQFSSVEWQQAPLKLDEPNVYLIVNVLVSLSLFLLSSSSRLFSGRMLGPLAALCVTLIGFFLFHNFSSNSGSCIGAAAATP
jgi:hypothetical protein